MKKILAGMLCAVILVQAALAFAADTTNWYAQKEEIPYKFQLAQILESLGLFQPKQSGYALDDTVTREEAAALIVRFLGEEESALAQNWLHPFSDVPAWADNHVGWLYQKGFTSGISASEFGAARNITGKEYETLLLRALQDTPTVSLTYGDLNDSEPFTRTGIIFMSYHALGISYTRDNTASRQTVAQHLVDKSTFTPTQLNDAAFGITYDHKYESGPDGQLIMTILGVKVAETKEVNLDLDIGSVLPDVSFVYAYQKNNAGITLYQVDAKTLQETKLGTWRDGKADDTIFHKTYTENRTVFFAKSSQHHIKAVFVYDGAALKKVFDISQNAAKYKFSLGTIVERYSQAYPLFLHGPEHAVFIAEGKSPVWIDIPASGKLFAISPDYFLIVHPKESETVLTTYRTASGSKVNSISIPQHKDESGNLRDVRVGSLQGNTLSLYGSAGYYIVDLSTGVLTQISDEIIDAVYWYNGDNRAYYPLLAVHTPGESPEKGSRIIRFTPKGEQLLLGNDMSHGLLIDTVGDWTHGLSFSVLRQVSGTTMRYHYRIDEDDAYPESITLGHSKVYFQYCFAADWTLLPEFNEEDSDISDKLAALYASREKDRLTQIGLDYAAGNSD